VTLADAIAALRRSTKFLQWSPPQEGLAVSETHYSPTQLAKAWGVSVETIRTIFRTEPGVLKIGKPATKYRRGYFTLRIPETVAERVHQKLSAGAV
jgi:hypothetical protein